MTVEPERRANMSTTKECPICKEKHNRAGIYCNRTQAKVCLVCGNTFKTVCSPRAKTLCSTGCTSIYANQKRAERKLSEPKVFSTCDFCKKEFEVKSKLKVNGCSPVCRYKLTNGPKNCSYCGKEFYPSHKTAKVCSFECSGKSGQTEEAKEKRADTNLKRYGVDNPFKSESIKEKIKDSNLERFGVENPLQNKEVRDKAKSTLMKKYGTINPRWENEGVRLKAESTNMEKYGVKYTISNPEVRTKAINTFMENYGANSPFSSPTIQDKIKKTNLERYGAENPFKSEIIKEKIKAVNLEKHTTEKRALLKENLVVSNSITQINKYWSHLIEKELNIKFEHEGKIFSNKRMSVDLYNEEYKLAIDINPTITHSTQKTPIPKRTPTTVMYHHQRALDAQKNGWELIQIFDWDNEEDILELLRSKLGQNKRIYARKCVVKEISHKESKEFLNANHRQQGKANSSIQYGLFYEDELVQVMTFSKERFSRKNKESSYELLRLTSKRGLTVVGGASKLLKAFQNSNYYPIEIKTFADFSKGTGESYIKMGMSYEGFANMNAYYSSITTNEAYKTTEITNKYKREYEALNQTQKEFMNNRGFYRINDAGHKIFKWKRTMI